MFLLSRSHSRPANDLSRTSRRGLAFRASLAAACLGLALAGCGGEDGDDFSSSTNTNSSTSGAQCGSYVDLISSSERARVGRCNSSQVTPQLQAADSYLNAAITYCQRGDTARANDVYQNAYKQQVQLTRDVVDRLCS